MRVLDFSRLLPGPLATKLLADKGASVTKLEIPHKPDPVRMQPPFAQAGEVSILYQLLNGNKTIEQLDYTAYRHDPAVRERLDLLLAQTDVLVEQYRPGVMSLWGLGYDQLQTRFPQLIYISITGYGQKGELAQAAGHDLTYLAYSGVLGLNCDADGKPVIPNVQIADIAGGSYAAVSACYEALYRRSTSQKGCFIDIAMVEHVRPLLTIAQAQQMGGWAVKEMNVLGGGLVNYNVYRCADGRWLALAALEIKFWDNFCAWAQRNDWRRSHLWELSVHAFPKHEMDAFFATQPRNHWVELSKGFDICLAPVLAIEELV